MFIDVDSRSFIAVHECIWVFISLCRFTHSLMDVHCVLIGVHGVQICVDCHGFSRMCMGFQRSILVLIGFH